MVYEKLFLVQQELQAPKDQYNSFGKYKYRSCESILEALKPVMKKHRMMVVLSDDVIEIGGRMYVEATATVYDAETGEHVSVTAFAREEESKKGMDGSQVTGASSSYARKYALNGLFAIDDNQDSDSTNTGSEAPKPKQKPMPQPEPTNAPPQAPAPEEVPYFRCDKCGKQLQPYINDKGEEISIRRHVAASKKKFEGKTLCLDCIDQYLGRK